MQKYNLIACGATFDHFHKGHEAFLRFAIEKGEKILLGLTSDNFATENRFPQKIEAYAIRKQSACNFLKTIGALEKVEIMPIHTPFIPKEWDNLPIEAIVVSKDVVSGAEAINNKRKSEGKPALQILECETVVAQDGIPISSVRIRNGEIDREGQLFINSEWKFPLHITPVIRTALQKPFGTLINNPEMWFKGQKFISNNIITVGDIVTKTFNTHNVGQKISVVDFYVAREKKFSDIKDHGFNGKEEVVRVINPAGTLTSEIFSACKEVFKKSLLRRAIIVVEGEEDLVVLPMILRAPLGIKIYYGQPGVGMVEITVTRERKKQTYSIIDRFQ